jgi:hypothetical protein
MTKSELKTHIDLYRSTEQSVINLDNEYGINIWNGYNPNFYNNYNLIIHNLLVSIFGDMKTDLIEDYIFNQIEMTFDELWETLNVEDATE